MRKDFLFCANWCRVEESFPQELDSSQVIENRAAGGVYPELESASLCGTCRALIERSTELREGFPPAARGFSSRNKIFYEPKGIVAVLSITVLMAFVRLAPVQRMTEQAKTQNTHSTLQSE
jgi:hypothetical protein